MPDKEDLLLVNNFHPETISLLEVQYRTHKLWECPVAERAQLINSLNGQCRAVATASWDCDPLVYELESLQIISAFGVGVDGIDFQKTAAAGVQVTNTPDVLDDAVADIAIGLVLATTRNLVAADNFVRAGQWQNGPFPFGKGLAGKTLGILGMGRIGEAIAARALPFKLQIAYHNRNKKNLPYTYCENASALARHSDILLCMLPGGAATEKVINADLLAELGAEGIFINVGRGTSVDEDALVEALENNTIAGAGLDVYRAEPDVPAGLIKSSKAVLFPHIGSATAETRRAMGRLVIDNLAAYFTAKPLLTPVE